MRILHLSWEYPPVVHGGLGRHVHALAEAQAALGHEVVVVSDHSADEHERRRTPLDEVVNGVRVVRVPQDPPLLPRDDLLAWVMGFEHAVSRAGARLAHEWEPEVVHGHDWLVAHAAATLRDLFEVPLVATVHATEAGRHQGWLPGPLSRAIHTVEWWLTYEARRVVTCSSHMRWEVTRLFDLPPDKVDVVPNGIDLEHWSVDPGRVAWARERFGGSGPLVVYTGRLEYEKGVHTLLDAMPTLRRRHPGIRLVVVGQGTHADELAAHARRRRLGRSTTFTGWLDETALPALAAAADVAVVPSIYEPFGMVALEATAAGTPLVVADTGGLRELVEHGVTGLRFTPGDAKGLAGAVDALLGDELLARRVVRQGREVLARDYPWSRVAEVTAAVYERAVREEQALRAGQAARAQRPPRMVPREGNLLAGDLPPA